MRTGDGWRAVPRRKGAAGAAIRERVYLLRYVAERDCLDALQRRVGEAREGAEGPVGVG